MKKRDYQKKTSESLVDEIFELFTYVDGRLRRQLALLLVLMLLSSFSEMISLGAIVPFLGALSEPDKLLASPRWQSLLATLQISSSSHLVTVLAIGFIVAVLVASGLRLLTLNVQIYLSANIGSDISCQIFQKTIHQPYQFHARHNSSDLMQTLVDDTNRLTIRILTPLLTAITDSILALGLIWALVLIDARIAMLAAVTLGGAYLIIYRFRQRLLKQNSKVVSHAGQNKIKAVQEGIGGIRDILIAQTTSFFQNSYQHAEANFKYAQAKNTVISKSPKFVIEAIAMSAIALLALSLGQDGDFSQAVPVLGALALGAKRLLPALQSVFMSIAQIQGSRSSLVRVLAALRRPVDPLLSLPGHSSPLAIQEELRLKDVWFRYKPEDDYVLQGLSFTIKAGDKIAFVGPTASGKTTIIHLLLRFYEPNKGRILVDGKPLANFSKQAIRSRIGLVSQKPFLFSTTIRENIAYTDLSVEEERVLQAVEDAQFHNLHHVLRDGLATMVGEKGVTLSGGQKQRASLARTILSDPDVLILDDVTSAVDTETEAKIFEALEDRIHRKTTIIISHRITSIQPADKIFVLDEGKVALQGSHEELILQEGYYRQIHQLQTALEDDIEQEILSGNQ